MNFKWIIFVVCLVTLITISEGKKEKRSHENGVEKREIKKTIGSSEKNTKKYSKSEKKYEKNVESGSKKSKSKSIKNENSMEKKSKSKKTKREVNRNDQPEVIDEVVFDSINLEIPKEKSSEKKKLPIGESNPKQQKTKSSKKPKKAEINVEEKPAKMSKKLNMQKKPVNKSIKNEVEKKTVQKEKNNSLSEPQCESLAEEEEKLQDSEAFEVLLETDKSSPNEDLEEEN